MKFFLVLKKGNLLNKIAISKNISFCFGVENTINLIKKLLKEKKYKNIYMLGEVVHNEHVIKDLKDKGLKLIKNFNKIPAIKNGVLIIQSHGISQKIYDQLNRRKIPYIDSTCLLVKYIHSSIKKLEKEGYFPIIVGNKNHTEVKGIAGHARRSIIIHSPADIKKDLFKSISKIGVVFQSTFIKEDSKEILDKLKKTIKHIKVVDTICRPTKSRQTELRENAGRYRSILIIGSKTSANTNHLYHIAKKKNKATFFIQKPENIENLNLKNYFPCFITSGASTPGYIIEKTIKELKEKTSQFKIFSNKYIPLIDRQIEKYFIKDSEKADLPVIKGLKNDLKEFCLRPGKRIRPLLLILTYSTFAGLSEKKKFQEVLKIASAIELMHSFLLIHDDIIDRAKMRRGKKSFHLICREKFKTRTFNPAIGEDVALVMGDNLFFNVIHIIAQSRFNLNIKDEFLKLFSQCYETTCWGQIMDSIYSRQKKLKADQRSARFISTFKTAYYTIFYPMVMGYILTGQNNHEIIKKIKDFALPLGLAFQIRDDILGIFGSSQATGKSDISDIVEGKFTLLINTVLKQLKHRKKEDFKRLFSKEKKSINDIKRIKDIIQKNGVLEKLKQEMEGLFKEALKNLKRLNIKQETNHILEDLIDKLRDY